MIDNRIRTIRFWLLSAAVCGACSVNPGWAVYFLATYAMAPLGLFMPVFDGGGGSFSCEYCSSGTAPTSMQVVISGVVDDICTDCEQFNATWELTQGSTDLVVNACPWEYNDAPFPICPIGADPGYALMLLVINSTFDWRFGVKANSGYVIGFADTSGTSEQDCHGLENHDLPLDYAVPPGVGLCDFNSAVVEVTSL